MKMDEIAALLEIPQDEVALALGMFPESIKNLKTPEEAKHLYENCPGSMRPAVVKKWEELVERAIPVLKTPEEAKHLYENCPRSMRPALIKKLAEM